MFYVLLFVIGDWINVYKVGAPPLWWGYDVAKPKIYLIKENLALLSNFEVIKLKTGLDQLGFSFEIVSLETIELWGLKKGVKT